jgi:hypothetical protein
MSLAVIASSLINQVLTRASCRVRLKSFRIVSHRFASLRITPPNPIQSIQAIFKFNEERKRQHVANNDPSPVHSLTQLIKQKF